MRASTPSSRLLAATLGVLVWATSACSPGPREREAMNLVLISLDTTRADRLSCYGAERPTPALDAFAKEAVRFSDCLSQSTLTAPSHLSMLTGQYVHRHGLSDNGDVRHPAHTLASVLHDRGWRTAAFTGHGLLQGKYGHGKGFEVFESWPEGKPEDWPFWRDLEEALPAALAWLDQVGDQPFFLFVHGYDPHQPYYPPEPWLSEYAGWYEGLLDTRRLRAPQYKRLIQRGQYGSDEQRYVADLYDGEVANADRTIGGFFDALRERGLMDRSVVVFTSDHGESFGNGQLVGHGAMLEEVLHVPLLIRFPEGRYAGVRNDPVQLIDLMPTLLASLGVAAPEGLQGTNLLPAIRGGDAPFDGPRMRLAQIKSSYTVRFDDRWKIFARFEGEEITRKALYDLENDPLEQHNLYESGEGVERYDKLLERFLSWRAATLDDDRRFQGADGGSTREEDIEVLRGLGYVGDDRGDDQEE